jgi:hypothetical protein
MSDSARTPPRSNLVIYELQSPYESRSLGVLSLESGPPRNSADHAVRALWIELPPCVSALHGNILLSIYQRRPATIQQ